MREYKFRVWDKQDKRMITHEQEFIPLKVTNLGILRLDPCIEENRWELINGDRFEIMQYTGVNDKNGKEIYLGDILQASNGGKYEVIWHNCGFATKWLTNGTDCYLIKGFAEITEVIGNIYENPNQVGSNKGI